MSTVTTTDISTGVTTTRPMTPSEQADFDAAKAQVQVRETAQATIDANRATILSLADAARATNTTFLAIVSPTTAQVATQVKALTQQNNRLIRLLVNKLDGTN